MNTHENEEISKQNFTYGGITVGMCSGWDGDQECLMFTDVEPSKELIEAFPGLADVEATFSCITFVTDQGYMQVVNDAGETIFTQKFKIKGV